MKETTKRNLQLYSNFTLGVVIGIPTLTKSQVVYTDINPDQIVLEGNEFYLDLDTNSDWDFKFSNTAGLVSILTSATSIYYFLEGIWATALPGNSIFTDQPTSWIESRNYPVAMEQNDIIDELLHFETWPWQRMAWRKYVYGWNGYSTTSHYCCAGGYWFPEQTDKYLGVRFADAEGLRHYGWIRCDVKDEGRTLIVKDYAYEATPEKGILAGDTLGLYVGFSDVNPGYIQCYYADKNLVVVLPDNQDNGTLDIIDAGGKKISSYLLSAGRSVLNVHNLSSGYFIAVIKIKGHSVSKPFIVE